MEKDFKVHIGLNYSKWGWLGPKVYRNPVLLAYIKNSRVKAINGWDKHIFNPVNLNVGEKHFEISLNPFPFVTEPIWNIPLSLTTKAAIRKHLFQGTFILVLSCFKM